MTEFAAESANHSANVPPPEAFKANRVLLIWFSTLMAGYMMFSDVGLGDLPVVLLVLSVLWFMARRDDSGLLSLTSANKSVSVGTMVGVFLLSLFAGTGIGTFFSVFAPQQLIAINLSASASSRDFVLSLLTTGLLSPFSQEYVFRWVALRAFAKVRSPLFAVLFSASLFALVHGSPVYAAYAFPMGFIMGLFIFKTRQFWAAVLVHAALNIYVVVATQLDIDPFRNLEVAATPLIGVAGLIGTLGAMLLAVRWLGLPSRHVETRGRLWSGSLVMFILISVTVSVLVTVSV